MKIKVKALQKCGTALGCLTAILTVVLLCGISWIATCGLVKLITLCFGWTFSWGWATGVWLVMILLKSVFSTNSKK